MYNTIGDKQRLFFKCIDHYTQTQLLAARQRATNTASPLQAVIGIIEGLVDTTTSLCGLASSPRCSVYNAGKWALEGWSESMACDLHRY